MEKEIRNNRITKIGVVTSAGKMNKTIVVSVVENKKHPMYNKFVKSTKKYKVHDEENVAGMGDTVEIMETRPLSKDKYNRLIRVVEKAK
jgi:small subunit ribosomal protein S17